MITPDVAATSFGVLASYLFFRWLRAPSWERSVAAGLALGLAECCKATWIVLYALWPLIVVANLLACRGRDTALKAVGLGTTLGISIVVVNICYLCEGSLTPLRDYQFTSQALKGGDDPGSLVGNRFSESMLGAFPVPFPRNYIAGIDRQKLDFELRMWSYLRGEWRLGGWWYYYLYASAVKLPIGTLLLFVSRSL